MNEDLELFHSQRPFIMSDGTFYGSGKYSGTWLTGYNRDWFSVDYQISAAINLSMMGILMVGAEPCGTFGEFNPAICARSMQNSILMPAVRNYYKEYQ